MAGRNVDEKLRCSFCNKTQDQVKKLIAGPNGAYICDECVGICADILDEEFETELPMPEFDEVEPAAPIADMSKATIALITTGGVVPEGNPDKVQSASAQKWAKYDVSDLDELKGKFITIHGGFDPVYCNAKADRVAPLDQLTRLKKEGVIGNVFKYFYTTTGTGTSVANAKRFGKEIGQELKDAKVDGVIMTST